jgi:proteasome accessory factor C
VAERITAEERLERILYLLPAAARQGGARLEELARTLDVDVHTLLEDVEVVTDRSFYHPPGGSADELQLTVTSDRLQVWTAGSFRRPPKLSLREALALALGLRMVALGRRGGAAGAPAAGGDESPDASSALLRRLEKQLAVGSAESHEVLFRTPDLELQGDDPLAVLVAASESRRTCRLLYLKPDSASPVERTLAPYAIAYGEGQWYVIGHSAEVDAMRVFRLDRVLEAHPDGDAFEVPADFDASAFVADGRVFQADEAPEVHVRYSPRIARWIEEREEVERLDDGSVIVRHVAASPRWLVSHVLQYGAEAEVVEPEAMREVVKRAVGRMIGGGSRD